MGLLVGMTGFWPGCLPAPSSAETVNLLCCQKNWVLGWLAVGQSPRAGVSLLIGGPRSGVIDSGDLWGLRLVLACCRVGWLPVGTGSQSWCWLAGEYSQVPGLLAEGPRESYS